jgi:5'-methylthioadenosine phosphorylase
MNRQHEISVGVIGGSGVYELSGVKVIEEIAIDTPFGSPSDRIVIASTSGGKVAFLPRHGKGHRLLPSEVPSKANIWALKSLGVRQIIGVSAVGSLKEEIRPTDIVLPSQIIDRTKGRPSTYFGNGIVGHVSFADPFCEDLRAEISGYIAEYLASNHPGKRLFTDETYVCMEGPQFSTRAESELHRSWGAGVIGMTAVPESKLAREAEICYAMIALPTDYDCWREGEAAVDVSQIVANMEENNRTVNLLLPYILERLSGKCSRGCSEAAKFAVMTRPDVIPAETKDRLSLFYGKYLG